MAPRRQHDGATGKGLVDQRSQSIGTDGGFDASAGLSEIWRSQIATVLRSIPTME